MPVELEGVMLLPWQQLANTMTYAHELNSGFYGGLWASNSICVRYSLHAWTVK